MKKALIFLLIIYATSVGIASEISDSFSDKYKALVPSENSSVKSDYLFEQIALGSEYTIKMLEQINGKNENVSEKIDILIEKFDVLIEQNKMIIKLLEK